MILAVAGLLVAPQLSVLWVVLAGLSSGSSLVVALSLIGLRGRSHAETTRLSGMAQAIGYLLAACGPVVAGWLARASGAWQLPLTLVLGIAAVQLVVALLAGTDRRRPVPS